MKLSIVSFLVLTLLCSCSVSVGADLKTVIVNDDSPVVIRFFKKIRKKAKKFVNKLKTKAKRAIAKVIKKKAKKFVNKLKTKVKRAVAKATAKLTKILVKKRKLEGPLVVQQRYNSRLRYVALGDSYAAGAGSGGGALGLHQLDFDKCCARNRNAYPSLLHRQLGTSTFTFRACFGARAIQGPNNILRQMRGTPSNAQLVTVTVGGNDMGFNNVIKKCITSAVARKRCSKAIRKGVRRAKTVVARDIRILHQKLRQHYPSATIVFTGYPIPYSRRRRKLICHNKKIRLAINKLVAVLNANIKANVKNFVPVSFKGRELCSKRRPWINGKLKPAVRIPAKCSPVRKVFIDRIGGFYHPSAGGSLRYSQSILNWYTANLRKSP